MRRTLLALAPAGLVGAVALTQRWPALFRALVGEDGLVEWLQVGGFAAAALGLAALGVLGPGSRALRIAAVSGALLLVVVVGEELSWGQRHLGVSITALEEVNDQGDLTLHNVGTGLRLSQLGMLGLALAGVALVGLYRVSPTRPPFGLPAGAGPPAWVAGWFAIAAALTAVRVALLPSPSYEVAKLSEVAELAVAAAVALSVAAVLRDGGIIGRPAPAAPASRVAAPADVAVPPAR